MALRLKRVLESMSLGEAIRYLESLGARVQPRPDGAVAYLPAGGAVRRLILAVEGGRVRVRESRYIYY